MLYQYEQRMRQNAQAHQERMNRLAQDHQRQLQLIRDTSDQQMQLLRLKYEAAALRDHVKQLREHKDAPPGGDRPPMISSAKEPSTIYIKRDDQGRAIEYRHVPDSLVQHKEAEA